MTRGGALLAVLLGAGDFAFAFVAVVAGAGAGAGAGSEPRRPTLRDSLLKNPSDELALAFAEAVLGVIVVLVTATIGSLFEPGDVKLNDDGVPSGARGIVAWAGTVPGAGPLEAIA